MDGKKEIQKLKHFHFMAIFGKVALLIRSETAYSAADGSADWL